MSLNANIILAGAQPDILGAMSRGNELAAQTNTAFEVCDLRAIRLWQAALGPVPQREAEPAVA